MSTNWAQFRFSGTHTGTNPHENVLSAANAGRLCLDCSFRTRNLFRSSPAVANGVVYIGSDDDNMYAFDLAAEPTAPARPNQNNLHPDHSLRRPG